MAFPINQAERLKRLPPYLFAEIDRLKRETRAHGVDVIDLGIGDPDIPTPQHVIDALAKAATVPENHRYPSYEGLPSFREAVAQWYMKRFGVALDPATEVLALIGSKEGTAHMPLAFVNPGDVVLVPDPGYPVYQNATYFAGGEPYLMPLKTEREFLPDLDAIPSDVLKRAKLIYLNYPNNPTAACAPLSFFRRLVEFAERHQIIVCHDAMYSELCFNGFTPSSFLEADGAKVVGIEFHSLSKTYSMTGWRIGFCVGNPEVLSGLGKIKSNVDSGVFQAVQYAGIAALTGPQDYVQMVRRIYQERRDVVVSGLKAMGWPVATPKATFFVWSPTPNGRSATEIASRALQEAGVVITPGIGFGSQGEGFIRIALTVDQSRLAEAMERLKTLRL